MKVTDIYRAWASEYKPEIQERIRKGDDIFDFSKLKNTAHAQDSMDIYNVPNPKIIMAGSGMSAGGRIVNHEMHYLPDTQAILLFVGYQSLGTLGRDIQDGAKMLTIHDQQIPVKAEIDSIDGYSSHKDSEHLVEFVASTAKKLNTVFVAMGEPKSAMFLAQRLRDNLGVKAVCPELGNSYPLEL